MADFLFQENLVRPHFKGEGRAPSGGNAEGAGSAGPRLPGQLLRRKRSGEQRDLRIWNGATQRWLGPAGGHGPTQGWLGPANRHRPTQGRFSLEEAADGNGRLRLNAA